MPWDVKALFDKSVQLRQLSVCETNNMFVALTDKGRVSVFSLDELRTSSSADTVKTKLEMKERRVEAVVGCQLFAMCKHIINKATCVLMAAVCSRRILLLRSVHEPKVCNHCDGGGVKIQTPATSPIQLSATTTPTTAQMLAISPINCLSSLITDTANITMVATDDIIDTQFVVYKVSQHKFLLTK